MAELYVTSALLPVPHGFSVRAGGVSTGPYASLNLGFAVGDVPALVKENWRRLCNQAQLQPGELAGVSQVHGDLVLEVSPPGGPEPLPTAGEADALWTARPGAAVGVKTADCVPLLLVDPVGRRVAAVHSGWRGTEARIAARAVEALVAKGSRPEALLAAVGPCIQACCYEVSSELGSRFEQGFASGVVARQGPRVVLSLAEAVRQTLEGAGVGRDHIDVLPACTACDAQRFFSHRRDKGVTGRHLSFVVHRFAQAP
jgi:polyphenol oxidase